MNVTVSSSNPHGKIKAIASKSIAHRILICAAFADKPTRIRCEEINNDIKATVSCLSSLGADICYEYPYFQVSPIKSLQKDAILDCGESGSTLRFLIPIVTALGANAFFDMHGRLPERPLSPLKEELEAHGALLSYRDTNRLYCEGQLSGLEYSIAANVSSQFISGILFALAIWGKGGTLKLTGKIESAPYIDMTTDTLKLFGVNISFSDSMFTVLPADKLISPKDVNVEGDWSGAAFPICMGVLGQSAVEVFGLNLSSRQGDREILNILRRFGADIVENGDSVIAKGNAMLHGINIDASQIPDLVPVMATVAATAKGTTVISGAERLRIKESDRLSAVKEMLNTLGANITETKDGLIINGVPHLCGGIVSSYNDHRIAMSAAVASAVCQRDVTITDAEATSKSYPQFWNDIEDLSVIVKK
ncbi:MAG: 3-phosphoshikimate 1-carboxyvinyltransferase [Clostridia bacterium]|nr:3-phosphoshikimate 1-carboxyvinyltransferase [Clostridia bacterium]